MTVYFTVILTGIRGKASSFFISLLEDKKSREEEKGWK